ncbi:MAG TPA: VOC family protein [Caulobacteraceae bacterium]|jgi:hypothetical protein|nr:VOC family protein [Caulobacteraceae bacterium]
MASKAGEAPAARFRWYELHTTDRAAAEAFYGAVVGWRAEHIEPYTTFNTDRGAVAGMVSLGESEGPARWIGYVAADDVDASLTRIKAAGGTVRRAPVDAPGLPRFAGVADPQGAAFGVYKAIAAEGPPMGGSGEAGYVGWHELWASDGVKAFDFYATMFGWTRTTTFDMGPMGVYQLWTDGRDGDAGGMMTRMEGAPGPVWNYYFQVDSVAAAVERIAAAGGTVINGPHQVPSGDWIVQGTDPQGAAFSLMSGGA